MRIQYRRGFTLLELLVVIGSMAVLAAIGIPTFQVMRKNVMLSSQAQEIVSTLRVAQTRSITSQDGTPHGVYFDTNSYALYGDDWAAPAYSKTTDLQNGVEILQGSGTELTFGRLTGNASSSLTVVVGYDGGKQKTITVEPVGKITIQ